MNKTKIEWAKNPDGTPGFTWNPITGCLNGCDYCYARKLANTRLKERYLANCNVAPDDSKFKGDVNSKFTDPFYPRFWPERLKELSGVLLKPKGIFVCDMSDLFGIGIPEEWTRKVLDQIRFRPRDRFYLLTKQPQNLIKFSPFPDNCFVGQTLTGKEPDFYKRMNYFEYIEAKVKFISFEPLLAEVGWPNRFPTNFLFQGVTDWVIIGAQTKPTVMPKIEWVQEILVAAHNAGIPVFMKDNLQPLIDNSIGWGGWKLRQEMPA